MSSENIAETKFESQGTSTQQPFNVNDIKNALGNTSFEKSSKKFPDYEYTDDDDMESDDNSTTPETEIISTNTLFRMITRSFDGKRSDLQEFLRICDTAHRFATRRQKNHF